MLKVTDLDSAPFEIPEMFAAELKLGGVRPLIWKKLEVNAGSNGFIELDFQYDVAQIYVDGKLAADQYDCGFPWRIPASILAGKECYLVMSPRYDRIYREEKETESPLR